MDDAIDLNNAVVIDFETYYDNVYTLAKVTTERYIRGAEFECIGASIKVGSDDTRFYEGETWLELVAELADKYPTMPFVSHNNKFDMGILGLRYGIHPKFMVDTAVLAKLTALDRVAGGKSLSVLSKWAVANGVAATTKGTTVHDMIGVHLNDMTKDQLKAYADYCVLDTELCSALYYYMIKQMDLSVLMPELAMADITTRMFTNPVFKLDDKLLVDYEAELKDTQAEKLASLAEAHGLDSVESMLGHLRSSAKFCKLLAKLGVEAPVKWSEKQQKYIPAVAKTDQEFLDLLDSDDQQLVDLVEAKLTMTSSMEQTRTNTFIDIASRGLMPIPLSYSAAHTGRYGGCFVADTKVLCKTPENHISEKNIVDVLPSDLVWDGEDWCEHSGVEFNGYQHVITHDGLTGTPNHRVFINDSTELTLVEAMQRQASILDCELPPSVPSITVSASASQGSSEPVPVYDITNCGPRHRYMANGKLVHNSDKVNVQNLSKRTKEPVLRRALTAGANKVVLASDSSQIEARLNAYLSGQDDLIDLFIAKRDPYVDMASAIFGLSYDDLMAQKETAPKDYKRMRNLGKEAVLACGYGMSAATFKARMELSGNKEAADMAEVIVGTYRTKNSRIVNFWKVCGQVLDTLYTGGSMTFGGPHNDLIYADGSSMFNGVKIPSIRLPNGTHIWYQNLRVSDEPGGGSGYVYDQFKNKSWETKRIWGSALVENCTQALAFAVLKWQALEINSRGVPIHLNVHDEWVSVVPKSDAARAAIVHYQSMKRTPPYIPDGLLDCEVDVGLNYADLKTIDVEAYL